MRFIDFGWLSFEMPKGITMELCVRTLIHLVNYVVVYCMARLGLFTPLEEDTHNSGDTDSDKVVMMLDWPCPSLVPVPAQALISSIKKNLPILSYGDYLSKLRENGKSGKGEDEVGCGVCLEHIETHQEIRDLSNCKHLFHRECLDRWVDEDQFSCPFCRSMLLPSSISPWMVMRNSQ